MGDEGLEPVPVHLTMYSVPARCRWRDETLSYPEKATRGGTGPCDRARVPAGLTVAHCWILTCHKAKGRTNPPLDRFYGEPE